MENILLVVQVITAIGLIGMVLIQRSETDGFGLGSGGGSNLLSGRAKANLMTRTTAILATIFIVNSLILSIIASSQHTTSIVDQIEASQPKVPAVPMDTTKPVKADKKAAPAVDAEGEAVPVKKAAPAVPAADADESAPTDAE